MPVDAWTCVPSVAGTTSRLTRRDEGLGGKASRLYNATIQVELWIASLAVLPRHTLRAAGGSAGRNAVGAA